MEILESFQAAKGRLPGCSVALGNFDGVHLGHRALFIETIERARAERRPAGVATFEPHPGKVLFPELAPLLLTPLARKLALFEEVGLDFAIVQPFDRAYAAIEASEFLERELFGPLQPGEVVVGSDFTFGRARAGTLSLLRSACEARGVRLCALEKVACGGVVISSTKIRELVGEGRVAAAARLLGRPFEILGEVVRGDGRGRLLGFPTANVSAQTEVRPAHGVYAVRAWIAGRCLKGVANIGRRPTFEAAVPTVEVFLFDFTGDLYGAQVRVELIEWLRGEQKFESASALAVQIAADCARAREVLARPAALGITEPSC